MAKLGDFKTPTGGSGNILNPMDWLSFILGPVVIIIAFAMGQNFASKLGKIPGIDASIDALPLQAPPAPTVDKKNSRVIL